MVAPDTRSLPHNLEAERSLIGVVITSNGAALDELEAVKPEHFYAPGHQQVYAAAMGLHAEGVEVELVSLVTSLRKIGSLERIGGPGFVSSLADGVPRSTNLKFYAKLVQQAAAQRALITLGNKLLDSAYEADRDANDLISDAEMGLLELSGRSVPGDLVPSSEIVTRLYPVLEKITVARQAVTGLATGFSKLDHLLRGLQPGNLVILGARPSQGKSTIAGQIALHAAQTTPVAFFSLEMSEQEHAFRSVATLARVDGHLLQSGLLPPRDQSRVGLGLADFSALQFHLDDTATLSALQIRSKARRLKARHGLGLIVVDYLQLLKHEKADSREQQVAASGRMLKHIARELEVPVLALCQLNRGVESRAEQRPKLSDLRESGSLEQDCDVALLLYRPPPKENGMVNTTDPTELIVAKSRNGPTGWVDMRWIGEQYRFEEIA